MIQLYRSRHFLPIPGKGYLLVWGLLFACCLGIVLFFTTATVAQERLRSARDLNEKMAQLAGTFADSRPDYVIGSGDLLKVDVFDVDQLSREVRVAETGHISLPLIPVKIQASGLTAIQLEEKLSEILQSNGLVSSPHVTVFIREHLNQPITVIGAVNKPTVIPSIRRPNLIEALTAAGGLADDAGDSVIIQRKNYVGESGAPSGSTSRDMPMETGGSLTITLHDLLESGDPRFNVPLAAGDVVSVPRAGIVYVVGAVRRPGGFVLKDAKMSALKALAMAQGPTSTAKLSQALIIRVDPETGREIELTVDLKRVLARKEKDVPLSADDILFIPDSTGKKILRRAAEVGISITSGLLIWRR